MIKFTGSANYEGASIRMFGDGVTKNVSMDLSKAPFNMSFKGYAPTDIVVHNISPGMAKSITLNGDVVTIRFETPPPKVEVVPIMTEAPEGRLSFELHFVYGNATTAEEWEDAHRKDS